MKTNIPKLRFETSLEDQIGDIIIEKMRPGWKECDSLIERPFGKKIHRYRLLFVSERGPVPLEDQGGGPRWKEALVMFGISVTKTQKDDGPWIVTESRPKFTPVCIMIRES